MPARISHRIATIATIRGDRLGLGGRSRAALHGDRFRTWFGLIRILGAMRRGADAVRAIGGVQRGGPGHDRPDADSQQEQHEHGIVCATAHDESHPEGPGQVADYTALGLPSHGPKGTPRMLRCSIHDSQVTADSCA